MIINFLIIIQDYKMKKKIIILALTMYIVTIVIGCANKENDFRKEGGKELEQVEEDKSLTILEEKTEEDSSEDESMEDESSIVQSENEESALNRSFAEDEDVRKAQEAYMKTLHSRKGESVVTRSEGESVSYTEIVKTEEAGKVDFYYYAFLNTSKEYESTLKSFMEEDDGIILEQNADALYIKMKRKDGMSTYFESVEESAIRGNEFETYLE